MLTGTSDAGGLGRQFRARLAWSFFSLVAPNWDKLSDGQPGDDGDVWPRNTKSHLAYTKGRLTQKQKQGAARSVPQDYLQRRSDHLTPGQMKRWRATYRSGLADLATRMPMQQARGTAANAAWRETRAEGAPTILSRWGDREDTTLVDEGTLRRSMTIGQLTTAGYTPGDQNQVAEETTGELVVGTRAAWASAHHKGSGRLPVRRFWPKKFPTEWWSQIMGQAEATIVDIVRHIERGTA